MIIIKYGFRITVGLLFIALFVYGIMGIWDMPKLEIASKTAQTAAIVFFAFLIPHMICHGLFLYPEYNTKKEKKPVDCIHQQAGMCHEMNTIREMANAFLTAENKRLKDKIEQLEKHKQDAPPRTDN